MPGRRHPVICAVSKRIKIPNKEEVWFMDIFEEWLNRREASKWVKRALTDKSYKNIEHDLPDENTNAELATYGDAIIKMCYAKILLDQCEKLSVEIEKYISDERLATVIAKHYKLNDYLYCDDKDPSIIEHLKNYQYQKRSNKNNPDKIKATAVEAMIGAIFEETNHDLDGMIKLLDSWRDLK